jgi:hypothetical protein
VQPPLVRRKNRFPHPPHGLGRLQPRPNVNICENDYHQRLLTLRATSTTLRRLLGTTGLRPTRLLPP